MQCTTTGGQPWFLKFTKFEACPIYRCASEKGNDMCDSCKSFPCRKFLEWYSPRVGFFRSSVARIGSLYLRRKLGDKKWRKRLLKYEVSS